VELEHQLDATAGPPQGEIVGTHDRSTMPESFARQRNIFNGLARGRRFGSSCD
jgi:hypothetical protein